MHPNVITMYQERFSEFMICLKRDIYPDSVPLSAKFACTDDPVKFEDRLKLEYKEIRQGEVWGHEWQSAWFNFTAEVPEHFSGKELCLLIHTGGEALMFDQAGNPIYALTGFSVFDANFYRDRYVIGKKDAGTKLNYWIEGAANGLFGILLPDFHELKPAAKHGSFSPEMRRMELAVFNREVWELMIDMTVMESMMKVSTTDTRRGMRMLYEINQAIDIYNFNPANAAKTRLYLKEKVFSKTASSTAMTTICIGHAHIDVGWMWPVRESIRKAARTFSTQLALMEKYPDYIFGASQAELYMMVKENYPALYERIKEKVKEGRWEIQGGMWVEADCNLISGESMVRQFLYGKNFFMDEFGYDVKNLWIPDVFGYSASMPQIIKKSGCDYFLTQKISWSRINKFPHNTFRWRGIDGTEVITHFPPEDSYNALCTPEQRIKAENRFKENAYLDEFISLLGIGDGGGGPSEEYLARNERLKDWDGCPKAKYGTAAEFFEGVAEHEAELPYWDGELYLEMHRGTLTTQAMTKKGNRYCEQALAALEFFASCADLNDYPSKQIANAYRDLLRNQFHDILPGSSIKMVYDRTEKEHAETLAMCKTEMKNIAARIFETAPDHCTIVNTLSTPWSGILELPESWCGFDVEGAAGVNENSIRITVPATSFTVIKKGKKKQFVRQTLSRPVLENEFVRYEFAPDGSLISAYDKTCRQEFMAQPGNIMAFYKDLPPVYDAWEMEIYYKRNEIGVMKGEWVSGFADDVASELNFVFRSEKSVLSQRIVLRPDSKRLDFITHADWREGHILLRTEFPTVIRGRAIYDIQYGQIERTVHDNTSWDLAQYEVCGQRYADLSCHNFGMALLNDCKYGYRIKDGNISLSLLRAPKHPDFEADIREHDFVYSLLPHAGDINAGAVCEEAAVLNRAPYVAEDFAAPADFDFPCRIESDGVSLEIVKKAEKSNAKIVRLVEYKGSFSKAELLFGSSVRKVSYTNLIEWENGEEIMLKGNKAELTLKPYEIVTLKLEE
ncbi:MAG: alpha-mannosidase [Lentisphaerae bacterium]|nr:alpha-mannosidase [Lentisphaerota bacterium]